MTNNYRLINRLNELNKQVKDISNEINEIIMMLEVDPIEENTNIINKHDGICISLINKYIKESGNILNKEQQHELSKKVYWCNDNNLTLIKLLRYLNFKYEYIDNNKDWKDIKIEIKELRTIK